MMTPPNETDTGNGSDGICRVIDASRSPSPHQRRSSKGTIPLRTMICKITSIFTAFAISSVLTATATANDQDTAPFSHLVDAVVKLKSKTIPQAYFWLGSPQVPDSTIFTPDTKNGGFVMIVKRARLPDNSERVFYSDKDWNRLVASVKKWTVSKSEIAGPAFANQWKIENAEILVLRIPEVHADLLAALLKGWKTNETDFRCGIHWN